MKMNRYDAIRINGKDMRRKIMYIHNNINDEETLKVIQVIGDDLNDLWDIHDTIKLDNTTIIILEQPFEIGVPPVPPVLNKRAKRLKEGLKSMIAKYGDY